jgi:predicted N-formylglutamate amidohydrolase
MVLTCEHAFGRLPAGIRVGGRERRILASHHGVDIGAWALTRAIGARLAATAVGGRWSRLWIDLNRATSDPELIRRSADGIDLPWNAGLSRNDRQDRIRTVHRRYHDAIDSKIRRLTEAGVRPLLLSIHSFTGRLGGRSRNFDCGVLYDRDPGPARRLAAGLREERLSVRYNQPYSGKKGMMYSIQLHGATHGLPCLELELHQSLIDSPSRVAVLAPAISRAVGRLLQP